jgi:7TM protein involved in diverse intracellular signaling
MRTGYPPQAVNGVLDLSSWDFTRDGTIELDGEWEFYWRHLLYPADFSSGKLPQRTAFFNIPGSWNGYVVDGKALGGNGFATFRLKVKLPPGDDIKAVRIRNFSSAYTLWINGKITAQNGVVGKSRKTMTPRYILQESVFAPDSRDLDLVLQVSNFNHRKGGAWNPISLGTEAQIKSQHNLQEIIELLLFGSLLMMGLYHISLYLLRRDDVSPLYFAAFTLLFALRSWLRGITIS